MKAKEMADRFNAATAETKEQVVKDIMFEAIQESRTLAVARKVNTDAGMTAVIRECDDKWRAFAKLCPTVSPDAFKVVLHKLVPSSNLLFP